MKNTLFAGFTCASLLFADSVYSQTVTVYRPVAEYVAPTTCCDSLATPVTAYYPSTATPVTTNYVAEPVVTYY